MKQLQLQQGDVLIHRIKGLPDDLKKVERKQRGLVLAEGETTGHAHCIVDNDVEMYERDGVIYLSVLGEKATLVHEEHQAIEIPNGTYEIGIVQEIDPFSEQVRQVVD